MIRHRHNTHDSEAGVKLRIFVLPSVGFIFLLVLGYQAWSGERGFQSWMRMKNVHSEKIAELEALRLANDRREVDIRRLQTKTLDLDYLDELARRDLGLVRAGERIVFLPQPGR